LTELQFSQGFFISWLYFNTHHTIISLPPLQYLHSASLYRPTVPTVLAVLAVLAVQMVLAVQKLLAVLAVLCYT
jgi:hypothetical protein